jgi:two-component system sensor histidine kinase QseC
MRHSLQVRLLMACLGALAVFAVALVAWLITSALAKENGEVAQSLAQVNQAAVRGLADAVDSQEAQRRFRFLDQINHQLLSQPVAAGHSVSALFEGPRRLVASSGWPDAAFTLPAEGSFTVTLAGRTWTGHLASAGPYLLVQMVDLQYLRGVLAPAVVTEVALYAGLAFIAIAAALLVALRSGLRPLHQLASEVARRGGREGAPYAMYPAYVELVPLVEALNAAQLRGAESRERERRLIQETAHALTTPLMALEEQARALGNNALPAEVKGQLARLASTAARSNRMGRQLLKLAILDTGPSLAPVPQDVMDLLRDTLAEVSAAAARHGTAVELEGPERLTWTFDEMAFRCIVDNLLSNALKYGAGGRGILVSADVGPQGLTVVVADDGPGLDPGLRDALFEPFRRGPKAAGEGAGLGLAIVRRAAVRLGAAVSIETSEARQGCAVSVTLPSPT